VADFEVLGEIEAAETIAEGNGIRDLPRLLRSHGFGRWRKRKGVALIGLPNGTQRRVELHWYEAHGVGRVELKIKRYLE
jgi:hypothetical protein